MRPSVALCLLTGLAACEEESLCERAAAVDDAGLVFGIGREEFEAPIGDGETLQQSYGSQGGTHLYLAVRSRGFGPGNRRALAEDEDMPVFTVRLVDLDSGEQTEQWFSYEAMHGDEVEAELALGEFFLPFGGYATEDEEETASSYLLSLTGEDVCGTVYVDEQVVSIQ